MILSIGNHQTVMLDDVIGIFDMDRCTVSGVTRKFLSSAEKRGETGGVLEDLPKSFLLVRKNGKTNVLFSPLSPASLIGRVKEAEELCGTRS